MQLDVGDGAPAERGVECRVVRGTERLRLGEGDLGVGDQRVDRGDQSVAQLDQYAVGGPSSQRGDEVTEAVDVDQHEWVRSGLEGGADAFQQQHPVGQSG